MVAMGHSCGSFCSFGGAAVVRPLIPADHGRTLGRQSCFRRNTGCYYRGDHLADGRCCHPVFASRLNTEITEDAISFRFRPFYRSGKVIHRDEIASFKVGTYNPILEYGGWGIRQGWQKKKVAYNVSGKEGLTLTLKNGKSILIGTRRVQAITAAMEKMMRGKDI